MDKNIKTSICYNMLFKGECNYNEKCNFAHSLKEQHLVPNKKYVYDLLKSTKSLENIDLHTNDTLYKELLILCKLCIKCSNKKCTGGLNCRYGACLQQYVICEQDLKYGNCKLEHDLIHLTKRGLKPYNVNTTNISDIDSLSDKLFEDDDETDINELNEDETIFQ